MTMLPGDKTRANSDEQTMAEIEADLLAAIEADRQACEAEDDTLYLEDLNPEICTPDMVYDLGDREAWVYEHDNIAELVFVRV